MLSAAKFSTLARNLSEVLTPWPVPTVRLSRSRLVQESWEAIFLWSFQGPVLPGRYHEIGLEQSKIIHD